MQVHERRPGCIHGGSIEYTLDGANATRTAKDRTLMKYKLLLYFVTVTVL